jgi:hypothetical protein
MNLPLKTSSNLVGKLTPKDHTRKPSKKSTLLLNALILLKPLKTLSRARNGRGVIVSTLEKYLRKGLSTFNNYTINTMSDVRFIDILRQKQ